MIHAGLYYPAGSLKAITCVRGRDLLYAYAAARHIPHRRCGKLVVAVDEHCAGELGRIAAGAAYGGGSIGLLGVATVGVRLAEAHLAKRTVGGGAAPLPPAADGLYGRAFGTEDPLRLALLGDSTAAGQGVRRTGQTPGALLASGLAAVAERPVLLRCEMSAGHGGVSGRYERWRQIAFEYAWTVRTATAG